MQKIKLHKPIEIDDGENKSVISELNLPEELLAGHVLAMDSAEGDMGKLLAVLSEACGEPLAVLKKMSLTDLNQVTEMITELLGKSQ